MRARRPKARRRPIVDYYRALEPEPVDDESPNPVEVLVEESPGVRAATRQIRAREKQLDLPDDTRRAFVRYADARSALGTLREEALFNFGVEIGLLVGRGEGHASRALPKAAHAQLQAALKTAARALEQDGFARFADSVAVVLRTAFALASGPGAVDSVKQAAEQVARRKPRAPR